MDKLGTRSYGYILEIMSKVENFHLALKKGDFKGFWKFWGLLTLGVKQFEVVTKKLKTT